MTEQLFVIKKDGTLEEFNPEKIIKAVTKSATRVMYTLTDQDKENITNFVLKRIEELGITKVPIFDMHHIVEGALESVNPKVAKSYRDYRDYKQDFVKMLDDIYKKSQSIMYIGDKENSNSDSALVSTKR